MRKWNFLPDFYQKFYNPKTLHETQAMLPQLLFQSIITDLAPSKYYPERLIVASPEYLQTLSKLLQNTSEHVLQSYFMWKAIQGYAGAIDPATVKPLLRFNNELRGKDPDVVEERWRTCIAYVDDGLGWILSRFFIEKSFSEKARLLGDRIVSDIKNMFIKRLKEIDWMDEEVVKLATDKGKLIRLNDKLHKRLMILCSS